MQLSFLIQLILLFLLIICIYLVFTKKVEGKSKLVIIIFCLVIGLYLYSKLNLFTDYDEYYSSPTSAKNNEITISGETLKKSDGQLTTSIWIFIDDWNYKYGEEKFILQKSLGNGNFPFIKLDSYKNDLIIGVDTYPTNNNYKKELEEEYSITFDASDNVDCCDNNIYINDINTSDYTGINVEISCNNTNAKETRIENINMQKWVNIITTISNRSLDVYINGKLIKTKTFENIVNISSLNDGDIVLVPNSGFGGYISKIRYYPYYITPQKAWNIYKEGFGDAFESALNKYNLSVALYEDDIEQNKFYLF